VRRKQGTLSLATIIVLSTVVATAFGAYIGHYIMTRPASVTVTMNGFESTLYADAGLTAPLTSLSFPETIQGDISGSTANVTCYIALSRPSEIVGVEVRALWRSPDLPEGMTLTAKWQNGVDSLWWNEDTYSLTMSASYTYRCVTFMLDTGNAEPGDYGFTVEIEVGEWS